MNIDISLAVGLGVGVDIGLDARLDVEGNTSDKMNVEVCEGGGLDEVDPSISMHMIEQA